MANQSIQQILHSLGESIEAHLKAANDNRDEAVAELTDLKNGLLALVNGTHSGVAKSPKPSNPAHSRGTISGKPSPTKKPHRSLEDSVLLNVLGSEWSTAIEVRAALLKLGHKIAEGTVYNRMRKLAKACSDVESADKPERWRLVPRTSETSSRKQPKGKNGAARPPAEGKAHDAMTHMPVLHHGDCFGVMSSIPDESVDLILVDLPYGVTGIDIDHRLDMDALWMEYRRIITPTGNIVLFGSQPFTNYLINAAKDLFKYSLVWEKPQAGGHMQARNRPMKSHEDILIFSKGTNISKQRSKRRATYNPLGARVVDKVLRAGPNLNYLNCKPPKSGKRYTGLENCPRSVLKFSKEKGGKLDVHPFQKPLELLQYLIEMYSNPGELVLDNTMGSGSTCVAAIRCGRRSIGIEKDEKWFKVAEERVRTEVGKMADNDNGSAAPPKSQPTVAEPVVSSASLKLYQGDCLDVMRTMQSGSVDLIFTSPPYNLGVSSGGGMRNSVGSGRWKNAALADGYASYDDARDPDEYVAWQKEFLTECWRLLSPTGAIFYQHKPRGQNKVLQTPLDLNPGLPVRQIIIWNRNNGFNFNNSYFLSTHEWVVVFAKPDFRLTDEGKRLKDVWTIKPERNNPHPAPFPVDLPLTAIQATSAKGILDPFMSSGTTGVAALRCEREFIGIELDPGYLNDAHQRIVTDGLPRAA